MIVDHLGEETEYAGHTGGSGSPHPGAGRLDLGLSHKRMSTHEYDYPQRQDDAAPTAWAALVWAWDD